LVLRSGPGLAQPLIENIDRTIEDLQEVPSVFMVRGRNGLLSRGFHAYPDR
jgi:hypothetical protein